MSSRIREHDWISKYLEYEEMSEPPRLYKEWVAMSTIAAVLQRKCKLPWGPLTFYPNMYVVLVGPSGKCRKGTAMHTGEQLLNDMGIKLTADSVTREALIRSLNEASVSDVAENQEVTMHASLTIFSKELAVFLGYDNKQLISDLTDWYDCADRWTYRTKGQGTDEIIGLWVNLLGATTPELIQTQFPEDAIGGGLASRIVFVYEDQKGKVVAAPFLEKKHKDIWKWLRNELESIAMLQGDFKWNDEFLEKWIEWYHYQEENKAIKDDRFQGYLQRRPNHILKMCMILSASSRKDMIITGKIFDRALKLLRRTEKKMPRTFSGYGKSESSDITRKIMEFVGMQKETTRKEVMKQFYYDLEGERHLDQILNVLKTIGFAKIAYKADGGGTHIKYQPKSDVGESYDDSVN